MADGFDLRLSTGERVRVKLLTEPDPEADQRKNDPPEGEDGKISQEDVVQKGTGEDGQTEEPEDLEEVQTGDAGEDPHEETVEQCDHGWYPAAAIGLGVLSLLLIAVVVLQALKLRRRKQRRRPKGKKHKDSPAAAPALVGVSGITVGKLHNVGARESQQDSLAVTPEDLYGTRGLLAVVADGMGGLADGDKMSQAAASAMMAGYMGTPDNSVDMLLPLVQVANSAVNRLLGPQNRGRSGTTLVAGIVKDGLFSYASVGDSRICLYRGGMLTQLNREHVYRNELATQAINGAGTFQDAVAHPKAGGLTSYLGMGSLKYVDIPAEHIRLLAGDKIILMSDGVYNALNLQEMESAMGLPAQQAADQLGQLIQAKAHRHQDNYTAVILECG